MSASNGPLETIAASFLVCVDVFTNDNCVIDKDAKHDNKCKKRHHVDRDIKCGQQPQRPKERDWNAETNPERQSKPEKQGQHDKDEHESS